MKKDNIRSIELLDNIEEVGLFSKLEVFEEKEIPIEAMATDLALLTGAVIDKFGYTNYLTKTTGEEYVAVIVPLSVDRNNHDSVRYDETNEMAIRPALKIYKPPKTDIVEYGEYPMFVENNPNIISALNNLKDNNIKSGLTGKKYTLQPGVKTDEYEFNGMKYVPVTAVADGKKLSNGNITKKGQIYWVKVQPINWYVDQNSCTLISEYALLSGVPYFDEDNEIPKRETMSSIPYDSRQAYRYCISTIKTFMDNDMLQDITTISKAKTISVPTSEDGKDLKTDVRNLQQPFEYIDSNSIDQKMVRLLRRIIEILSTQQLNPIDKKIILEAINRKKQIDKLPDGPFKEKLNRVLYLDLSDIHFTSIGLESRKLKYESFKNKIDSLLEAIELRSKTLNLELLKTYINVINQKVKTLCVDKGRYADLSLQSWRAVELFIDKMVDALVLDDNKLFDALIAFDMNNSNNAIWKFMSDIPLDENDFRK